MYLSILWPGQSTGRALTVLNWTRAVNKTPTYSQMLSLQWRSSLKYFPVQDKNWPHDKSDLSHHILSQGFLGGKKHRWSTYKLTIFPATRFTDLQLPAKEWLHSLTCSIILTTRAAIDFCSLSRSLQRKTFCLAPVAMVFWASRF